MTDLPQPLSRSNSDSDLPPSSSSHPPSLRKSSSLPSISSSSSHPESATPTSSLSPSSSSSTVSMGTNIPAAPPLPPVYLPPFSRASPVFPGVKFTCNICLEETVSSAQECGMGHQFCTGCLGLYFAHQAQEGVASYRCPMHFICGLNFPPELVRKTVGLSNFAKGVNKQLLAQVKEEDWVLRCQGAICPGIVIGQLVGETVQLNCQTCGISSSLSAREKKLYKKIHKKAHLTLEQKLDSFYIATRTRSCPHCHKVIERNEGCPHMTCVCGEHFCWNCGGKYHRGPITLLGGKHNSRFGLLGCSKRLYPDNPAKRIATRTAIFAGGATLAVTLGPPVAVGGLLFVAAPYGIYRGVRYMVKGR